MDTEAVEAMVEEYLAAFAQQDLEQCMTFFAEDARLNFAMGVYQGREDIAQWHRDRFAAEFRVLKVESIKARADAATVDAIVTSKLAALWRMNSVRGRVKLRIAGEKISKADFGLRTAIPIERW